MQRWVYVRVRAVAFTHTVIPYLRVIVWSVPALTFGQAYKGPKMGVYSPCQCSTMVYSVVSACATCQGAPGVDTSCRWTDWKVNCSRNDISVSRFPPSLPSSLTVPAWAYLNVTAGAIWSANASLNSHDSAQYQDPTAKQDRKPGHRLEHRHLWGRSHQRLSSYPRVPSSEKHSYVMFPNYESIHLCELWRVYA
ncbi:hypothetical protein JB92DRAFT_1494316 [Gautieria morchelliformis]|nr:hypothetical protein JB92DRAFT_1494316 [Gautieria morchelliformis]